MRSGTDEFASAADAFNLNILRFKNLRDRVKRAYGREAGSLKKTAEAFKQQAMAYFRLAREPSDARDYYFNAPSAKGFAEDALSWATMLERQLERIPNEAALGREMAFVYLMAIFDGFVGRWCVDLGFDPEDGRLEVARPNAIRAACQRLGITVAFPEGFDSKLDEMRVRRNVLVHRGGIADERYVSVAGTPEALNQRLAVSEDYLDDADRFVTELVWTLIAQSPRH